jgi:Uma2 family endonuclease
MIAPLVIPKKMVPLTDDELLEICSSNDQLVIERNSEGELIIMSPVGGKTETGMRASSASLFFGMIN